MGDGLFIALEGAAGAGTLTQLNLLKERLQAVGYEVAVFDFPHVKDESGYFIRQYLDGAFGSREETSPYAAALFYAMDRQAAAKDIRAALQEDKIVLATGYVGSTMADQGSRFSDDVQRRSFFVWADNLEFQLLDIPRPNISIYLRLPADVSYSKLADNKSRSSRSHLRKSLATYDLLCQLFPKDFRAVECYKNGEIPDVAEVNNMIWDQLKPLLPAKKAHPSRSVVVTLGVNDSAEISAPGRDDGILKHDFKDASLLLRLHLQRLAPEGISHNFDGWREGKYKFYSPGRLSKDVSQQYQQAAEQLSILHQQLLKKMTGYMERTDKKYGYSPAQLLQPLTPLGALSDFSFSIKKNIVVKVAGSLLASDSEELQWAAKQLYLAARQKWPDDFTQPLESLDGPASLSNIIAKMADQRLPQVHSLDESIKLLEARPRLEFDLLAESVYPYSSLSLDEISEEISDWPYSQKYESLKEAASSDDVLRKVVYKLDVLSDHLTLDKIIQTAGLRDMQVQSFTPRYGYDMPQLVDAAAADDLYDATFDKSLELYSLMQSADREDLTPYTTLLGHKLRWQATATAAQLAPIFKEKNLLANPTIKTIADKLAEAHPLLWEIITNGQTAAPAPERKGKARVKQTHHSSKKRGGKKKS